MTTLAPEPIAFQQQPKLARSLRQSIDRSLPWPPEVTWAFGHSPVVERGDTVLAAELMTPADGVIALRMCKADGQEYGIEFSLPSAAAQSVLDAIQPGMTLAAVGAVEPTASPSAVES
jgi:hypothetical protein